MSENHFAAGNCLCGQVSLTIDSKPLRMAQCHCDDCRKLTGTGHVSLAFFNRDDVKITGETSHYASTTDSGSTVTRHFCSTCGSRLFGTNSKSDATIGVSVGILENTDWFKPECIVYNRSKPDWDVMDDTVPVFDAMPPA